MISFAETNLRLYEKHMLQMMDPEKGGPRFRDPHQARRSGRKQQEGLPSDGRHGTAGSSGNRHAR